MDTGFPTVVRRLCLGPGCAWVWVWLALPVLAGVLGGCVWVRFVVLSLFCRLFVVFLVGLGFRPAYGRCVVACALCLPRAVSGSGVRCGRACWSLGFRCAPPLLGGVLGCVCARAPVLGVSCTSSLALLCGGACLCVRPAYSLPFLAGVRCVGVRAGTGSWLCPALLGWVVGVCFLRFFFGRELVWLCGVGCWLSLSRALWSLSPHPLSFGLGCWLFFFFFSLVCVCMFRCPFSRWAAVPGLVLPVLAGWFPCPSLGVLSLVPSGLGVGTPLVVLAGGLVAVGCSLAPPPLPPLFLFFWGGGGCLFLPLPPWAGARTGPHSVWSSGLLLAVAFCLAVFRPHGSGGLCTLWARCPFLPG